MKTTIILSSGNKLELLIDEGNMKRILRPVKGILISKKRIKSVTRDMDALILKICRENDIKGTLVEKDGRMLTLSGEPIGSQLSLFSLD